MIEASEITSDTQKVVAARRLDLRPLRRSDAGLLALYAGDARVASMTTTIPHPLPPGAAEAFIARANAPDRPEEVWALDGLRAGLGELLGVIALRRCGDDRAEIGYWVGPAFWHAGFASEAVEALLHANPLGLATVTGTVFQCNPHSAKVLTRAGFDYTGDGESYSVAQNRTVPTWTYRKSLAARPTR